ncbi:TetR/AcrR family transcriptional regulator [Kribbella sp. CA-253562]|uniref:TetR/AcrR family transcriptional regulator n=1 Tax=Kribbella sp. CA-253562 TaxID=3239942 RepID=UPI003D91E80B
MTEQPRRQARGQRRMEQLTDAAAVVFAEVGYAKATTNAIARQAGVSPGTLYQFFANKEALAGALADRYRTALQEAHARAFDPAAAQLPLPELIDRMIRPMVEVNLANPGFKALFAGTGLPEHLTAPARALQAAVTGKVAEVIAARAPDLPADRRQQTAVVATQIFAALLGTVLAAPAEDRESWIAEVNRALVGYLTPVLGDAPA